MEQLPILLLDNFFLFPGCDNCLALNERSESQHWRKILIQVWKNYQGQLLVIPNKERLGSEFEKFAPIGTLAEINLDISAEVDPELVINSLKEIKLKGLKRVEIVNLERKNEIWQGEYQTLVEKEINEKAMDELTEKFVRHLPSILEKSKLSAVEKLPYTTMMRGNVGNLIDFIAQNSREVGYATKWRILASLDLQERLELLIGLPDRQKIDKEIEDKTREAIKDQQEEWYLREKLKAIERKLRSKERHGSSEMSEYLERLGKEPYPEYVKKAVYKEAKRYEKMHPSSNEAYIIIQYVDWLVNLPWWQRSKEINDLNLVRQRLDEAHYNLAKAKDKIIWHLAVQQQANKPLGEILLLTGPAGVGKSSFAKSVAKAIGREFAEISLGGARDTALIQGFIRTYVGAKPGILVQKLKEKKVINPVILLDEIDKVAHDDYRGSLLHVLLAVLDSDRNKEFVDHYLEVPVDLSQVMFICTANSLNLPEPLLDRMEIIHLSSYTELEKFQIAQKYLIPKNLKKFNLQKGEITFQDQVIMDMIKYYTWEAGVRKLNMEIQTIIKKFSEQFIKKEKEKLVVSPENLKDYLGKRKHEFTRKDDNVHAGVVNGLAWTERGGDILPIEVSLVSGEGKLGELTGSLGKVMQESAKVAFSYVQSFLEKNKENFEKELALLKKRDINIHAPEGAVEKEGPSAGVTLTTAIISALTGKKVPADIGMTGEITLKGKILKIGGLKEKSIAAHRSELKTIIIPKANEEDIEDIPLEVRQDLKIILVEEYEEVWKEIFLKKKKNLKAYPESKKSRINGKNIKPDKLPVN